MKTRRRPKRTPRAALLRVLAMAEEMSGENSYQEWDEEMQIPMGVREDVRRDLAAVRSWLGASPPAEKKA